MGHVEQLLGSALPIRPVELHRAVVLLVRLELRAHRLQALFLRLDARLRFLEIRAEVVDFAHRLLERSLHRRGRCAVAANFHVGEARMRRHDLRLRRANLQLVDPRCFDFLQPRVQGRDALVGVFIVAKPVLDQAFQALQPVLEALLPILGCRGHEPDLGAHLLVVLLGFRELLLRLLLDRMPPLPQPRVHLVDAPDLRLHLVRKALVVSAELGQFAVEAGLLGLHAADLRLDAGPGRISHTVTLLLNARQLSVEPLLDHLHLPAHR
mmetsp:Transcript_66157/g.191689  ORF Transcript_66157/g.191689 Transcript_66157/m.191689 type:complete len:267 (-) Transcript_66157:368-1168(-)